MRKCHGKEESIHNVLLHSKQPLQFSVSCCICDCSLPDPHVAWQIALAAPASVSNATTGRSHLPLHVRLDCLTLCLVLCLPVPRPPLPASSPLVGRSCCFTSSHRPFLMPPASRLLVPLRCNIALSCPRHAVSTPCRAAPNSQAFSMDCDAHRTSISASIAPTLQTHLRCSPAYLHSVSSTMPLSPQASRRRFFRRMADTRGGQVVPPSIPVASSSVSAPCVRRTKPWFKATGGRGRRCASCISSLWGCCRSRKTRRTPTKGMGRLEHHVEHFAEQASQDVFMAVCYALRARER